MPKRNPGSAGRRTPRISTMLADGHPIVREGVRHLLERHFPARFVAEVADDNSAIREAERHKPDLVIMGITMPGINGIEATRVIADKLPRVAVVILSMHSSPIIVRRAIEAGARGYLAKDAQTEELVRAVRAALDGKRYIGQGLAQSLLDAPKRDRNGNNTVEMLTATERNILKLVAEGKSNPLIAGTIGLSPRTVETYRLRLMRKLGLDNLAALVRYAVRHGIIPLD